MHRKFSLLYPASFGLTLATMLKMLAETTVNTQSVQTRIQISFIIKLWNN